MIVPKKAIVIILLFLLTLKVYSQENAIAFSINNFLHQKSDFLILDDVDTKGGFLRPLTTFGQHYILTKSNKIFKNFNISYGLGIGYTRIGFESLRSEDFLSLGRDREFPNKKVININTSIVAPVAIGYTYRINAKSSLNFSIGSKVIYTLRTLIRFSSRITNDLGTKTIFNAVAFINEDSLPDFALSSEISYQRRISNSAFSYKLGLNINYALTILYTGEATLFGDGVNQNISFENKLSHLGLSVGVIYVKQN